MLFFIAFITSLIVSSEDSVITCVDEFHQLNTKKQELLFYNKYKNSNSPSILAYVCSIGMKQATYCYNPISKLAIFKSNKQQLNELISSNPKNVHLRYIRLVLQENAPPFLGYNEHIIADKKFLLHILQTEDETDFLDQYIYKNTSI